MKVVPSGEWVDTGGLTNVNVMLEAEAAVAVVIVLAAVALADELRHFDFF
jgi:hypothetical protein